MGVDAGSAYVSAGRLTAGTTLSQSRSFLVQEPGKLAGHAGTSACHAQQHRQLISTIPYATSSSTTTRALQPEPHRTPHASPPPLAVTMPPRRQLSGISLKSLGRSIKNASSLSINRRDEEPLPTSNKLNISAPVPGTFQKLTPDIIPHDDVYGSTSLTSVPDAHDLGDQASASSQQPHALMTDDQVQLGNPAAHLPRAPRIPRWEERAQQRSRGQDVPRLGPFAPRSSSRTALSLSGAAPPVVPVEDAAREERTLARSHTSVVRRDPAPRPSCPLALTSALQAPVVGQAGPHDPVPRTPSLPGAWHAQHDRAMCTFPLHPQPA